MNILATPRQGHRNHRISTNIRRRDDAVRVRDVRKALVSLQELENFTTTLGKGGTRRIHDARIQFQQISINELPQQLDTIVGVVFVDATTVDGFRRIEPLEHEIAAGRQ